MESHEDPICLFIRHGATDTECFSGKTCGNLRSKKIVENAGKLIKSLHRLLVSKQQYFDRPPVELMPAWT